MSEAIREQGEAALVVGRSGRYLASREDFKACQFSSWYETFRQGPKPATIKSVVIPLPTEFIDYLLSDGVYLPEGATRVSSCIPNTADENWSSDKEEDENDDQNNGSDETRPQFSFPELTDQVETAIRNLGGSVISKLNWSAPKDATWMNGGTLKCRTAGDIYLLLKSSDFILHDLKNQENAEQKYELVLRKWCNLHSSMEFRCFVYNNKLVGVSQRNHTLHFPHLTKETFHNNLMEKIERFFESLVCGRWNSQDRVVPPNYVWDCYVDQKDRVWLVDFNVWGETTDALLYTWDELSSFAEDTVELAELRVVETAREIHSDPLSSYRAPIDTVELAAGENGAPVTSINTSFQEFMTMCERPSKMSTTIPE